MSYQYNQPYGQPYGQSYNQPYSQTYNSPYDEPDEGVDYCQIRTNVLDRVQYADYSRVNYLKVDDGPDDEPEAESLIGHGR